MQRLTSWSTAATIFILLMASLSFRQGFARNTDTLFKLGVEAYEEGDFHIASQYFETLIRAGVVSADLHYNIGNCRFRQKRFAEAILHYERALKINPGHSNAKYNLNLANTYIKDDIRVKQTLFLVTWWKSGAALLSSPWWLMLHLLLFVITLMLVAFFLISGNQNRKRTGYIAAVMALSFSLLALAFSIQRHYDENIRREAIILSESTTVRSGPGVNATPLVDYHEGTKVMVRNETGEWFEIITTDGHVGWIPKEDAEII
jgi:tetratricopeptide (TPR) repeat protein